MQLPIYTAIAIIAVCLIHYLVTRKPKPKQLTPRDFNTVLAQLKRNIETCTTYQQLSACNPQIDSFYDEFCKHPGIIPACSDLERLMADTETIISYLTRRRFAMVADEQRN